MTDCPIVSLLVLDDTTLAGRLANGKYQYFKWQSRPCVYGNCRARNICKPNACAGKSLFDYGYVIDGGVLRRTETKE